MARPVTRRFAVVSAVSACLLLAAGPAAADQCTSAKLRAIANREARLLRCQAKVARSGDPSLEAACDARAVARFATAFGAAGTCSGVQSDCVSLADDCRDKVRAALPDGTSAATASKCESVRLRAASRAAFRKLGCYARAARNGIRVDSAPGGCLNRAHTRFVKAFDQVTGCAVVWDSGAATPPTTNTAPTTGADPHSDPRNSPAARTQKSEFLKLGGAVVD